jgi:dipeptidyl aminopeptidase/acylaminoacyl peptidase
MFKSQCSLFLLTLFSTFLFAQSTPKKILDHDALVTWKSIKNRQISNDGNWVVYEEKGEEGDAILQIYDAKNKNSFSFPRGEKAKISSDSRFVVFELTTAFDSLRQMRRNKMKKEDLPKDSLVIFDVQTKQSEKIARVASFKLPEEWSGFLAYKKEAFKAEDVKKDSTKTKIKPKKENAKNGTQLVLRNLVSGAEKAFPYVTDYQLAKKGSKLLFKTTGNDSTFLNGLYIFDASKKTTKALFRGKGSFKSMAMDESGKQVAFLANLDTTDAAIEPFDVLYWKENQDSAHIIASNSSPFLATDWIISANKSPSFSKNGQQLFFGMAPQPILEDTTLLEEEKVNVEVWHWEDAQLHTQQKVRQKREEKRAYTVVWHPSTRQVVPLGALDLPEITVGKEGNADIALGYNSAPYLKSTSWIAGPAQRDVKIVNTKTGEVKEILKGIRGGVSLSPNADFVYTYLYPDSAWMAYEIKTGKSVQIAGNQLSKFYDELNDRPMHPYPYGFAGWMEKDQYVLVYDRYDIWKIDPTGKKQAVNLTNGRKDQMTYRYVRLDQDARFIKTDEKLLLRVFNEKTKESGYSQLDLKTGKLKQLIDGPYNFDRRPIKAKNSDKIIFTKGNFENFDNLYYTDLSFNQTKQISNTNPQQKDYAWGKMELYKWTSLDGQELQGLLLKPDNFDPNKKYPMIVNFYERSSNGLYRHRPPSAGRSTINYPFYASKGYIIFNPDVPYRVGYPGESCYNAVISGVTSLINEGFIDKENIGVQGHSWGGYQIAYLLTKTDIFKCAESGAPVVNMFSAYGGIRWGSGMSRMFQYEQTQSRIGGTIWEYPLRYIENSPIFEMDKTNTPVLIMHNDEDTAVPWYQGIEYFVALRRLGKPAWMLNYNGEPHWPVKLQNRKDFNIRMQQFFDYYLKGSAMPQWMHRGVPAIEKGKLQGLELMKN